MNYKTHVTNVSLIKSCFRKLVKNIIISNCGGFDHNYNSKLTLEELIKEKNNRDDQDKFKYYVISIDNIVNDLNEIFPFVDLTGIDLSWTVSEILNVIVKGYFKLNKSMTLEELKEKKRARKTKSL